MFVMALILGLLVFSIYGFSAGFSTLNEAPVNINQNPTMNKMFGNISVELNQSSANADSAREGLIQEEKNPIISTLGFVFTSILAATNTFTSMGLNVFAAIFTFMGETFGVSPIILGTITAIIIGIIVLGIWSLIRAGR
jgi:hypothetical protein